MKKLLASSLLTILVFTSCHRNNDNDGPVTPPTNGVEIPFQGKWQRQFEAGPGNPHTVSYLIENDKIRYVLTGVIGNADYTMVRDTFLMENNRFIGHTSDNHYYVLFTKDVSDNHITVYKKEVENVTEGLNEPLPAPDNTENHGWNVFEKVNE